MPYNVCCSPEPTRLNTASVCQLIRRNSLNAAISLRSTQPARTLRMQGFCYACSGDLNGVCMSESPVLSLRFGICLTRYFGPFRHCKEVPASQWARILVSALLRSGLCPCICCGGRVAAVTHGGVLLRTTCAAGVRLIAALHHSSSLFDVVSGGNRATGGGGGRGVMSSRAPAAARHPPPAAPADRAGTGPLRTAPAKGMPFTRILPSATARLTTTTTRRPATI